MHAAAGVPRRLPQTPMIEDSSTLPARRSGRFLRNSVFGTIGGLAAALGSILASVLVAHILGVESTGLVAFALWIVTIAAAIADLGIQQTIGRYLPELIGAGKSEEASGAVALMRRPLALTSLIATSSIGGYALWQLYRGGWTITDAAPWFIVAVASGLQALAGFTYGWWRGEQRFEAVAVVTAVSMVCQITGMALGSLWFGVPGALAGFCLGITLPALLAFRGTAAAAEVVPAQTRRRMVRYSLYAWAAALSSTFVWSRAEIFFLQRSWGPAAVGLFSVGVTLANVAAQGPMLLTPALLPHFSQSFGNGAVDEMRSAYATATRVLAFLVFPASFGLAAVMPVILPLMFGEAFTGGVPAAVVVVLAAGIGATSSVGSSLIMAMDRSDFAFLSGLIAAGLTVLAGFTLIPAFGVMGAAWSRALVQTFAVALGCWFLIYRMGFPLPLAGLGKLFLSAALCAGAARLCLSIVAGVSALPLAILVGAVTYVAAVRLTRALPPGDIQRMRAMGASLPAKARRGFNLLINLIGGPAPAVSDIARDATGIAGARGAD